MKRLKNFFSGLAAPDPAAYIDTTGYTDDFQNSVDFSEVVGSKQLQHNCMQIIYSGPGGDRVVIMTQRGTAFARFLEAYDAANYAKESLMHGTVGYKRRGIDRIPTTPGQVMVLAYMQQIVIAHASMDMYSGDQIDFGSHSAGATLGAGVFIDDDEALEMGTSISQYKSDKKSDDVDVEAGVSRSSKTVKNSDLDLAQLEEQDIKGKPKRRTATTAHPDVASVSDTVIVSPDLMAHKKGKEVIREAKQVEIIVEEGDVDVESPSDTTPTPEVYVQGGVLRYPEFNEGDQILGAKEMQAIIKENSGEEDTEDIYTHIKGYMHRVIWQNYVQATVEEYNLFDTFVTLSLGDALYVNALRKWLQDSYHIQSLTSGGFTYESQIVDEMAPHESVHAMGNPLVDLRMYLDAVFKKQPPRKSSVDDSLSPFSVSDGLWGDENPIGSTSTSRHNNNSRTLKNGMSSSSRESPKRERDKEEKRLLEGDAMFGFSMFRQYVDIITREGERRMTNNTRIVSLMLSACNGIASMYEEALVNRSGPGQIVDSDDITISFSKLKSIFANVEEVNAALARNMDEITEHIKMQNSPAYT